ncbi:hypothetical protein FHG87_011594 [Trinorchestia longiramus]|nr:hypothetical protein FHG87_011594 [Trinorchestia longiramus]
MGTVYDIDDIACNDSYLTARLSSPYTEFLTMTRKEISLQPIISMVSFTLKWKRTALARGRVRLECSTQSLIRAICLRTKPQAGALLLILVA